MKHNSHLDKASAVRDSETLDTDALAGWLAQHAPSLADDLTISQFRAGHSNLTYLLEANGHQFVLRRPPFGAERISRGHDMKREYDVLAHLEDHLAVAPRAHAFCDDPTIIGAPFYLMERVEGVILRGASPGVPGLTPATMASLSLALVDTLADIHAVDLVASGLEGFGKPEGYVRRQIEGWTRRYQRAQTDPLRAMDDVGDWLAKSMPADQGPALIHNDFKYDNVVLDPAELTRPVAVLDWEMATVGDPLMDLGTSLAYWVEADDAPVLHSLNLGPTARPGNITRREFVAAYAARSGRDTSDILFYYIYGLFKVAVIVQQLYYRFKQGDTDDERFAMFIHAVEALGQTAARAIDEQTIEPLG